MVSIVPLNRGKSLVIRTVEVKIEVRLRTSCFPVNSLISDSFKSTTFCSQGHKDFHRHVLFARTHKKKSDEIGYHLTI